MTTIRHLIREARRSIGWFFDNSYSTEPITRVTVIRTAAVILFVLTYGAIHA